MEKAAKHKYSNSPSSGDEWEGMVHLGFIGKSPLITDAYRQASLFARDPLGDCVLIGGEEGTGKLLMARFIHDNSHYVKRKNVFVRADCGAIDKGTCHSAFFGHCKGAFTGANDHHDGFFAQGRGGSLFVDEIGNLPHDMQPMLLNVVEYKSFRPVGGPKDETTDARLIFATNCNLPEMCLNRQFKRDLYQRIKRRYVYLPPLRDCKEDIRPLTHFLVDKYTREYLLKTKVVIPKEVFQLLENYSFPGNIRELDSIISYAMLKLLDEKQNVLAPEYILINGGEKSDQPSTPESEEEDAKLVFSAWVQDRCLKNAHLWQGRKSSEVPCFLNFDEMVCEGLKTIYETTGCKAVTASIVGWSVDQLRQLCRKENGFKK